MPQLVLRPIKPPDLFLSGVPRRFADFQFADCQNANFQIADRQNVNFQIADRQMTNLKWPTIIMSTFKCIVRH
jgi:uncharacterized protein YjbI with pentapeptide repeats